MLALESAIEGVETIYAKHDELRALQSLDRLIESSEIGRSKVMIEPREPLPIVNQAPAQTADADHLPVFLARAKGASLRRIWPIQLAREPTPAVSTRICGDDPACDCVQPRRTLCAFPASPLRCCGVTGGGVGRCASVQRG